MRNTRKPAVIGQVAGTLRALSSLFNARKLAVIGCFLSLAKPMPLQAEDHPFPADRMDGQLILRATVLDYGQEHALVSFNLGRSAGMEAGDPVWLFSGDRPISTGEVLLLTDGSAAARLHDSPARPEDGAFVLAIPARSLAILRDALPEGVHLRGRVTRLTPGRRTAWLNVGGRAGLKEGDSILIRRNGIPIARGRISVLDREVSLTTLAPLVGNAVAEAGDTAELWPAMEHRRWGRLNSAVLAAEPAEGGGEITIAGSPDGTLIEDRLVDLFRGDRYVGVAVVSEVLDPIARARVMASASIESPAVGDTAVVRPPRGDGTAPLSGAVFHVESAGAYCLVAVGEVDGAVVDEKMVVRRPDPEQPLQWREAIELTLDKVNITYSGAHVRSLIPNQPSLSAWEFAHRRQPAPRTWRGSGTVDRILESSRTVVARLAAEADVIPGSVVRLIPQATEDGHERPSADGTAGGRGGLTAAVVLHRAAARLILFIPPGWGDLEHLPHAVVEVTDRHEN